ncbi:hypothetical protein ETB97_006428 [Aspergillus alliaceus]|uniref:Isochorismatase-like domain-containing protein n=1 Tax=Petromyces alliaceus TaxID=209559 RepID=A0A8H5ZXR0_PETAA|nr:hypothetical protein ETB97_006428 [Aspergillus burnettii]
MATISRATRIRNPALFICDIQEKFRPVIYEFSRLIPTTIKLLKAANHLQIPTYITTQNRSKLGDTISELQPHLSTPNIKANIDKTLFSMITPEIESQLPKTTLDLLERGHRVYVIVDGVSSVNPEERGIALARLRDAGAVVTSSESVLFEVLGDAGHGGFRAISGFVKEMKEETKGAMEVFSKI